MDPKPFTVQRRVAFGDCDPARIYYTPRAIDYAVEAVEAWCQDVLGIVWGRGERYAFDLPFVRIDCDYLKPLVAGQLVQLQVWVVRAGTSSLTFSVRGQSGTGDTCLHANLVTCFVQWETFRPLPIPANFRSLIDRYRERFPEPAAAPGGSRGGGRGGGHPPERLASQLPAGGMPPVAGRDGQIPFSRRRRVRYGDCGPSGLLYAPRGFDYAVETVDEWFEQVLEVPWLELVTTRRQGAPFVSAVCEFLRPMDTGLELTLSLQVTQVGGASIGFAVTGTGAAGETYFQTRLAACFIDQDGFRSLRIPAELRQRIEAYRAAGAGNPEEIGASGSVPGREPTE
jgi:4-hydroxybenzoyl-CoA thioesterase